MAEQKVKRVWSWLLLAAMATALLAGWRVEAAEETAIPTQSIVHYDAGTDRLSIDVHDISLLRLLSTISLQSGVEIQMNPAVEQPVSLAFEDRAFEDGLKQITLVLDLNYAMIYQRQEGQDESAAPMLVYMKIVPKMPEGRQNLISVIALKSEAFIRAKGRDRAGREGDPPKAPKMLDYAQKRWQARLDLMPEEKRKEMEESLAKRLEERDARAKKKEEKRAEREERLEENRARRDAAEEELKASNPDRYELRQQRREELQQAVEQEITQQ